jgi:uncharacterized protein (DUF1499 family)
MIGTPCAQNRPSCHSWIPETSVQNLLPQSYIFDSRHIKNVFLFLIGILIRKDIKNENKNKIIATISLYFLIVASINQKRNNWA